MTTELTLEEPQSKQAQTTQTGEVTPMSMLQAAREQGASIEQMQQLMDLQFKWEANEARKAYYKAIAKFKAQDAKVIKDKENRQFGSMYAGIGNTVSTINYELSKFDLSANWEISQSDKLITVVCILSHAGGHTEKGQPLSAPPDTSGGNSKNPLQQMKSTITYLKIATYEAITGIASVDDPGDDDGNGSGNPVKLITDEQAADLIALMDEVKAEKTAFLKFFKIEEIDELPASRLKQATKMLEAKRKK